MTKRPAQTLRNQIAACVLGLLVASVGVAQAKVSLDAIKKEGLSRGPAARQATRSAPGLRTHTGTPGTIVANPANPSGWTIGNFDDGVGETGSAATPTGTDADFYGPGPATPPAGTGSFQQVIGTDGNDGTRILSSDYNGVLLADLTALSYWTYVSQWVDGQATYLQLRVDFDGDGDFDDRLFFEPVYQDGSYSGDPFPAQAALVLNTWQQWDALAGGWWTENDGAGGPPLRTLANYIALHPGARLITDTPAIRIQAGFGAGAWDDFIGYFDGFLINKDYYDFEGAPLPVHNIDTGIDYPTIQAAIDAAATLPGHTLVADPGTYSENVVLNKDLTIRGAQADTAACGRVTGAPDPATESIITGAAPGPTLLTLVTGSAGSTIDGFSFIGGTRGIESSSGPLHGVSILNNHFAGFTGAAIFLNDAGTDVTVGGNNMNGSSKTATGGTFHLDTDLFDGLHFTNNCVLDAPTGPGFFVDGDNNVRPSVGRRPRIADNRFENHSTNVGLNLGSRAFTTGDISGNRIASNAFDGLQGGMRNSRITGNLFDNNGRWGLALTSFGNTTIARGAFNDTITGNTFTANDSAGLFISAGMFAGHAGSNLSNFNDIVGNGAGGAGYGAIYRGTETFQVGCNWWGHIDGPDYPPANPNPPGDGLFATSAIFAPWLDGSITGSPSCNQFPPVNTTTDLTSDVNPSTCGQKVNLIATVSPITATGSVEFFDGGASLGTALLVGGVATLSTTTLPAGHRSLTASYPGDGVHEPSVSGKYVQNVHCTPTGTTTVVTTPCDSAGWFRLNVAGGGTVDITSTYPHAAGSLEFGAVDASSKADFGRLNVNADLLTTLSALAAELYRSSSSTGPAHIVPAIRLFVDNGQATNRYSYLVWEAVYNGYPVFPVDTWTPVDLFKGVFWQRAWKTPGPNRSIDLYRPIADWLQPGTVTDGDGDVSNEVGPNARVLEYEIGIGSGVPGTFTGAGDFFRIGFARVDSVFDFEPRIVTSLVLSGPAASNCGDKVVLSADLSPAVAGATIVFFDGATSLGVVPTDANGHAEISLTALSPGGHSFTASYSGSSPSPCAAASASNKVAHQVNTIVTTTTLEVSPPKSNDGEKVTLTATVSPSSATGTVEFFEGPSAAKKSLFKADPSPVPTFNSDPTPVNMGMRFTSDQPGFVTSIRYYKDAANTGPHTVSLYTESGTLLGTAVHAPAPGAGWEDVPLPTPVAIAANQIYVTAYHSASGFSYTVDYFTGHQEDNAPLHAPANGPGSPNGVYVYGPPSFPSANYLGSNYYVDVGFAAGTSLGSAPVISGVATLSLPGTLSVGVHSLAAVYGGDACHDPSGSNKASHEVNAVSATALTSDPNPSTCGEKVTFTATVTPATATGTVEFFDGATSLGSSAVVAGVATLSVDSLAVGDHSVTAVYSGDGTYPSSTSNKVTQTVLGNPTTTTLSASSGPVKEGTKVTLRATVAPPAATGTVDFQENGGSVGTAPVIGGVAELSLDDLMPGYHLFQALYGGDSCYASSFSDTAGQMVNPDSLPQVTVVAPNGGEILAVGSTFKLAWKARDDNEVIYVDLKLSRAGPDGPWEDIALMEPNDGTYDWVVTGPETNTTLIPGFTAYFRVDAYDVGLQMARDSSDLAFAIHDKTVPTLISLFQAEPVSAGIELRWQFLTTEIGTEVSVERGDAQSGPWAAIRPDTRNENGVMVALDRNTSSGQTYWYRLRATGGAGELATFGPLSATAGAPLLEFALSPAAPNPTAGRTRVTFTIPRETAVKLSLVDVQGRQVARLAEGTYRPGRYQATWNGTGDRGAVPVGVYFIQLEAGGKTFVQRLSVAR